MRGEVRGLEGQDKACAETFEECCSPLYKLSNYISVDQRLGGINWVLYNYSKYWVSKEVVVA